MYELWYDYFKPKYKDKVKLCYMDTDSFVIYIETEDFYKDIAHDVEKWFDTSELGGKIMKEFCAFRAKTYAYLLDDDDDNGIKKAKGTNKCNKT